MRRSSCRSHFQDELVAYLLHATNLPGIRWRRLRKSFRLSLATLPVDGGLLRRRSSDFVVEAYARALVGAAIARLPKAIIDQFLDLVGPCPRPVSCDASGKPVRAAANSLVDAAGLTLDHEAAMSAHHLFVSLMRRLIDFDVAPNQIIWEFLDGNALEEGHDLDRRVIELLAAPFERRLLDDELNGTRN